MFDKAFWGNMKLYSLRQLKQDEYNYCANAPGPLAATCTVCKHFALYVCDSPEAQVQSGMRNKTGILNNIALQILVLLIIAVTPRLIAGYAVSAAGAIGAGSAYSQPARSEVRFTSPDSYYYLRMARAALGEDVGIVSGSEAQMLSSHSSSAHKQALPVDMLRYAPEGFEIDHEPLLLSQLTAAVYRGSCLLTKESTEADTQSEAEAGLKAGLEQTALWLSVFLPILVVIPVVLLIRLLMKDLELEKYSAPAVFISGILSSLGALYLIRSQAGYYDTDCLITAFAALSIYFFYRVETGKQPLASAVLLGLVQGMFSRWWSGHVFYAGVVLGSTALIAAAELAAHLSKQKGNINAAARQNPIQHNPARQNPARNNPVWERTAWKRHVSVLAAVPAGIMLFGGAGQLVQAVQRFLIMFGLKGEASHRAGEEWFPNAYVSVREMNTPEQLKGGARGIFNTISGADGVINSMGGIAVCAAALIGLVLLAKKVVSAIREDRRTQENRPGSRQVLIIFILMSVWMGSTLIAGLQAGRYLIHPIVPAGILAGLSTAYALQALDHRNKAKSDRAMALVILFTALLFPTIYGAGYGAVSVLEAAAASSDASDAAGRGHYNNSFVSDDLKAAAEYLRDETPDNSVIASWWDYGYYYEDTAQRATLFDGGTQTGIRLYWISRAFATDDLKLSAAIIHMLAGSGDEATRRLLARAERDGADAGEAVAILIQILRMERSETESFLKEAYGYTEEEARELAELSHPDEVQEPALAAYPDGGAMKSDQQEDSGIILALTSDMADYAGWFSYFGYWKEESIPKTGDFRPVASGKGGALRDGENEYVLAKESREKLTVRIACADEKTQDVLCEGENGEKLRIRTVWYNDGRSRQCVTELPEDTGNEAVNGTEDSTGNGMEKMYDLVLSGAKDGTLTVWLLSTTLSDSAFGELYYKQGKWQDQFELIREPGAGNDGDCEEGNEGSPGEGGVTVSLWKVK